MAAYIDLNPVRARMVADPAEYRLSSHGEAMGGGAKGNSRKVRAGLVRAVMAHKGYGAEARFWQGEVSRRYRMLLLEEGEEKLRELVGVDGKTELKVVRKGMARPAVEAEMERLEGGKDVVMRKLLRCRVRYFTDGAVIGSREFVDEVFAKCRERFGEKRTSGARKMRGAAGAGSGGSLWSMRDLRVRVD